MNNDKINAARYEFIRTLSPVQFAEIFKENLRTNRPFDDIVDERRGVLQAIAGEPRAVHSHPLIGTEGWFENLRQNVGADGLASAKQFVRELRRVDLTHTNETGEYVWAVYFVQTDFWADAFETKTEAENFAAEWNAKCPPAGKSA